MSNVTIKDFARYKELRIECGKLSRQIEVLENRRHETSREKVKGSLPCFPYTEAHYSVVGIVNNIARINAKKDILTEKINEAQELYKRLETFLKSLPEKDREIAEALELYYIDCVSRRKLCKYLGLEGDGTTQMKAMYRYMRKFIRIK